MCCDLFRPWRSPSAGRLAGSPRTPRRGPAPAGSRAGRWPSTNGRNESGSRRPWPSRSATWSSTKADRAVDGGDLEHLAALQLGEQLLVGLHGVALPALSRRIIGVTRSSTGVRRTCTPSRPRSASHAWTPGIRPDRIEQRVPELRRAADRHGVSSGRSSADGAVWLADHHPLCGPSDRRSQLFQDVRGQLIEVAGGEGTSADASATGLQSSAAAPPAHAPDQLVARDVFFQAVECLGRIVPLRYTPSAAPLESPTRA